LEIFGAQTPFPHEQLKGQVTGRAKTGDAHPFAFELCGAFDFRPRE
jgi:hypothetical protein